MRANLQGKMISIVRGTHGGNTARIRDEVPDADGMVQVSIVDVIVRIPVGDIHVLSGTEFERHAPYEPITWARKLRRNLDEAIKDLHTAQDVENYMNDVFMDDLRSFSTRIWALAYFVTEEEALQVAQRILDQNEYNVQRFAFNLLKEDLAEYQAGRLLEQSQ